MCKGDRGHIFFKPVAHIAVLRRDLAGQCGAGLGELDSLHHALQKRAFGGEAIALKITQNERQRRLGGIAYQICGHDEAVAIVGCVRR